MDGTDRWRENWRAVGPPGAVRVALPRARASRREALRVVRALPPGTPVVLIVTGAGALGRCHRFAARAGVHLAREYLALPSAVAPAYLVEDAPAAFDVLLRDALVAPPAVPFPRVVDALLGVARALRPWRVVRAVAPGRIAVGSRA